MEIKITTRQLLNVLLVVCWIIFIGISIEAGSFIVNAVFSLVNPAVVPRLWQQVDLSALFKYDRNYFFVLTTIMSIVAMLKAWLFYMIILLLHNRKLDLAQPFNRQVRRFIFLLSYITLLTGLFSSAGIKYIEQLAAQGVQMPDTQVLRLGGADVWLLMAVILFIIAQVFKRGIELQTENELTV
jgi:hypothetical protein